MSKKITKKQLEKLEAILKEDSARCVNRTSSCKEPCFILYENGTMRVCHMLKLPETKHEIGWTDRKYVV